MTRVALVDPSAFTPAYDHALAAALSRAGATVDLYTSRFAHGELPEPDGYVRHTLFYRRARGAPGSRTRRAGKLATHAADMRDLRRLTRETADVTHLQWLAVPWLDLGRLPDRPRVLTAHDLLPREPRPGQVWLQRRLMDRMDAVVVHSEHGRRRLVEDLGVDPDRVHVIHHGALDHVARAATGATAGRLPAELHDSGAPVALCFGLLRPYKGLDTLLEAWRGIEAAQLWIVGRPMIDLDDLRARAAQRGVQLVTRYVADDEVAALFARADLAVLPYARTERFDQSGVLATALARGLASVVSDVGGFAEIAATGAARLVPAGDPAALNEAMRTLLADPDRRRAMGDAAAAAAAGPYSWDVAAQRTLRLYATLTGSRAPRPGPPSALTGSPAPRPTPPPALTFRRTGLDDPEVRALLADLPWGVGDLTPPEFADPDGVMITAADVEGPLGCVGVRRHAGGIGEIKRLFVRERGRRRGVARALLTEAEAAARDLGYAELYLDTHADEPAALFASAGWKPIPAYNNHDYARFWFAKPLAE